jgi:hypothetical protein
MTNFQKLVQELQNEKVPCNVKLFNTGDISIECGWDYPDEMFLQVDSIAEKLGIEVDVCAEVGGGVIEIQQRVAGGPRRY